MRVTEGPDLFALGHDAGYRDALHELRDLIARHAPECAEAERLAWMMLRRLDVARGQARTPR